MLYRYRYSVGNAPSTGTGTGTELANYSANLKAGYPAQRLVGCEIKKRSKIGKSRDNKCFLFLTVNIPVAFSSCQNKLHSGSSNFLFCSYVLILKNKTNYNCVAMVKKLLDIRRVKSIIRAVSFLNSEAYR
jgi:hypothetical protein